MKRNLKEFKVSQNLAEATASQTDLQFIRAKTARNDHFETRRYIADKILNDKKNKTRITRHYNEVKRLLSDVSYITSE